MVIARVSGYCVLALCRNNLHESGVTFAERNKNNWYENDQLYWIVVDKDFTLY